MSGVKDITVRAGQEIKINVPYKGVPQPTAKWYIGDNDLEVDSPRTTVKVCQRFLTHMRRLDVVRLIIGLKKWCDCPHLKINIIYLTKMDHTARL